MNDKMKVWNITYKHPKTGEIVRATTYAEDEASARKRAMELNVPTMKESFYWEIVSVVEDTSFVSSSEANNSCGNVLRPSVLDSVLFRGFHENEAGSNKIYRNGKWIKGTWVYGYPEVHHHQFVYIGNLVEKDGCTIRNRYMVYPDTVCEAVRDQYDLSGKRMFEGDLCYIPREDGMGNLLMRVCFHNGEPSVAVVGVEPQNVWTFRLTRVTKQINIIGNMFENPELISVVCNKE